MRECKSVLQRLEDSVDRKLYNLSAATFSSQGGLSVHANGINVDMREMEAQISELRSHAILANDAKALGDSEAWQNKYDALVSRVHSELLQAKQKLGRRQLLLGKSTTLKSQLDNDLVSQLNRVEQSLKESVERGAGASQKLQQGTSGLRGVSKQYKEFDQVVDSSKRLIRHYAKKEENEWRWFMAALTFFAVVVAFILYSRMPLVKSVILPVLKRSINAILSIRRQHNQMRQEL